jgi:hypothetical protein
MMQQPTPVSSSLPHDISSPTGYHSTHYHSSLLYHFLGRTDPAPMTAPVPFGMNWSSFQLLDLLLQALRLGCNLNSVRCFLWMKAANPNSESGWAIGSADSTALKNLFLIYFCVFGLFCCFASYYERSLVSWFLWQSTILSTLWKLFMNYVNHSYTRRLAGRFLGSEGMRGVYLMWVEEY